MKDALAVNAPGPDPLANMAGIVRMLLSFSWMQATLDPPTFFALWRLPEPSGPWMRIDLRVSMVSGRAL